MATGDTNAGHHLNLILAEIRENPPLSVAYYNIASFDGNQPQNYEWIQ